MSLDSRWPLLIFRSHGQRSRSHCWSLKKCYALNIFWPLHWKVSKLDTVDAPSMYITPTDDQVTWSKVKVNCWSLYKCFLLNIFWPLCLKIAKLGTGMPLESRFSGDMVKVKLLNLILVLYTQYLMTFSFLLISRM